MQIPVHDGAFDGAAKPRQDLQGATKKVWLASLLLSTSTLFLDFAKRKLARLARTNVSFSRQFRAYVVIRGMIHLSTNDLVVSLSQRFTTASLSCSPRAGFGSKLTSKGARSVDVAGRTNFRFSTFGHPTNAPRALVPGQTAKIRSKSRHFTDRSLVSKGQI